MYWYKRSLWAAPILLLICLQACKQEGSENSHDMKYFDLKGFFRADSAHLAKLNPLVDKTVIHNKVKETKKVHITDWGSELSLFSESDINKPAWRDSYNVQSLDNFLIYRAKDPKLKTQEILIKRTGSIIKGILIYNHTKNILYETKEILSYYPDSAYSITKKQSVRLLGTDNYSIRSSFN